MECFGAVLLLIYALIAFGMYRAIVAVFEPNSIAAGLVAALCGIIWPVTLIAAILIVTTKGQK
jgi:hypothetical protein